jgi:hypothetical protein
MSKMSEDRVTEALNALRKADVDLDTDPEAEIHALLAFRRQQHGRRLRRVTISVSVSAAAVVAALLLSVMHAGTHGTPAPSVAVNFSPSPPPLTLVPGREPATPQSSPDRDTEEIATDFYPLMVSAPPLERGLLVRVTVPASTMRSFGLSIGDDHLSDLVEADVLVGQDALARSIRFVSRRK